MENENHETDPFLFPTIQILTSTPTTPATTSATTKKQLKSNAIWITLEEIQEIVQKTAHELIAEKLKGIADTIKSNFFHLHLSMCEEFTNNGKRLQALEDALLRVYLENEALKLENAQLKMELKL